MRRTPVLFGIGALAAAAAMYFAGGSVDRPATSPPGDATPSHQASRTPDAPTVPRAVELLTLATGSVSPTERAAMFRLAEEADRGTLESLAVQVAALPNIEGRRLALEALLTRYVELDAPAAEVFARTLELPAGALTTLYTAWARHDAPPALAALGRLPTAEAVPLGIALLDVLGNDALGIARVLGAAPLIDADRFRSEAAAAKAAVDPAAAFDDALLLPPSRAGAALERIAVAWVVRDVYGALGAVPRLADDRLRGEFRSAILRAWTRTDAEAMVDYVLDLDGETRDEALRSGALEAFALIDPERALRAAETMSSGAARMIRRVALMALARDDPLTAIGIVATLAPGGEREQMLAAIATSYGRTDPERALAWAQSLSPPAPGIVASVLTGLARVDPSRAIELAFDMSAGDQQRAVLSLVLNGGLDGAQTAQLADRLLAMPNRHSTLRTLTNAWARRAPREALPWLLAQGDAAPSGAIAQAGAALARADPAAAIGYLDALPNALRPAWLDSIAEGYARNDPAAAASWIARHRGETGYEAAVATIAAHTAPRDPAAGARLLDSIDLDRAPDAATNARLVAAAWAREDPLAAGSWARSLPHADAAAAAVGVVATQWASSDPIAARGWALGLPAGAARDAALVQVVGATAGVAPDAFALVEEFSSPAARQLGVNEAVRLVAQRDAAAARQLADRYLTDARMREAAERFIERGRSDLIR